MKKITLIIAFVSSSLMIVGQSNGDPSVKHSLDKSVTLKLEHKEESMNSSSSVDKRLLKKYSREELNSLKTENPQQFKYINHCIENAFYVTALPEEKIKGSTYDFPEIVIESLPISNFYELGIDVLDDRHQSFIIKDSKKMLIVKSKIHIERELRNK